MFINNSNGALMVIRDVNDTINGTANGTSNGTVNGTGNGTAVNGTNKDASLVYLTSGISPEAGNIIEMLVS
jgi:hypothetical protein